MAGLILVGYFDCKLTLGLEVGFLPQLLASGGSYVLTPETGFEIYKCDSCTPSAHVNPLPWPGDEVHRLLHFHALQFWLLHKPSVRASWYYLSKSAPDSRTDVFNKQ